jgi:hypothetical protein
MTAAVPLRELAFRTWGGGDAVPTSGSPEAPPEAVAYDASLPTFDDAAIQNVEPTTPLDWLTERMSHAEAVVVASCATIYPHYESSIDEVVTEVILTVSQVLAGDASTVPPSIFVSVPGGSDGERFTGSPHSPKFEPGGTYLLFLDDDDSTLKLRTDTVSSARFEADTLRYLGRLLPRDEVLALIPALPL